MKLQSQFIVGAVSILMTLLSIWLHFVGPSTMQLSDEVRKVTVDYHIENEIFNKRPFTTTIVLLLVEKIGLSYQTSFYLIQFLLYFLTGPAFFYYLRKLKFEFGHALGGTALFLSVMPVMMAHFEPIHTWDDFWVYIFVPLSLGLAISGKLLLAALTMPVALLSRETTFLFLPFLFMAIFTSESNSKALKATLTAVFAIASYLLVRFALYGTHRAAPYDCLEFNFLNPLRTSDSIFSILVSLGFLWAVGMGQVFRNHYHPLYNSVRWNAIAVTVGFVLSTLLYGHARESRLFVPPAIFLIPLALWYVQANWHDWQWFIKSNLRPNIVLGLILLLFSIMTINYAFPTFEYRTWPTVNRLYLAGHMWLVMIFLAFELRRKNKSQTKT